MIQRETVECERYELDMTPGVAFGQCKCGEPKAKHSDAAMRAAPPPRKASLKPDIVPVTPS